MRASGYPLAGGVRAERFGLDSCSSWAAEAASGAFFLAQRAWTAFRAAALRSSALSPAQRAFPPCDWMP